MKDEPLRKGCSTERSRNPQETLFNDRVNLGNAEPLNLYLKVKDMKNRYIIDETYLTR